MKVNLESSINLQGIVVEVAIYPERITFDKGSQFEAEMANRQKVIVDDKVITTAENRRQWMHDKLDNWIDGVEE
jgi:hypothetical protein